MGNIIEIQNLTKNYGKFQALNRINLTVPEESIFGYLGPNGAGKTTTLKILVGLLHYSQGSVKIFGQEVKNHSVAINKQIGFLPDAEMPKYETIYRFLSLTGKLNDILYRKERISEVLQQVGLKKLQNRKIGNLSRGQKQRVGIANALLHDPQLLILDEPNSGLDPIARKNILSLLKDLAKEGKSIILSSHIIGEVDKIATNIAIIHRGKIIEAGKRNDLTKYLAHRKYIISGKIIQEKVLSLDYVTAFNLDSLDRVIITVSNNITEEQLLLDLIQKCDSKIKFFSLMEFSLEDLFFAKITEEIKGEDYP
ncbi:ABC transporter ATP-binding protein [Candidatus Hodarchaeum mangrovi]